MSTSAAIYARVSTVVNGQSPDMQLRELREYCGRLGWQIAGEYVDTGISGAKGRRPQLDRMISEAHKLRSNSATAPNTVKTIRPAGVAVSSDSERSQTRFQEHGMYQAHAAGERRSKVTAVESDV
jgi:hypothetical protein